jgi:hypothetical protein
MGFSWKSLGKGLLAGIDIGAKFNPKLKKIDTMIDAIEARMPDAPGAHKLETLQAATDVVLEANLGKLTTDEQAEAKALRDEYVTIGVRIRNDAARAIEISKRFDELFRN